MAASKIPLSERVYTQDVIYLNNSPHIVTIHVLNEAGEKELIGSKTYKPVTGNMPEDQWNKLFHGVGTF